MTPSKAMLNPQVRRLFNISLTCCGLIVMVDCSDFRTTASVPLDKPELYTNFLAVLTDSDACRNDFLCATTFVQSFCFMVLSNFNRKLPQSFSSKSFVKTFLWPILLFWTKERTKTLPWRAVDSVHSSFRAEKVSRNSFQKRYIMIAGYESLRVCQFYVLVQLEFGLILWMKLIIFNAKALQIGTSHRIFTFSLCKTAWEHLTAKRFWKIGVQLWLRD